MTDQYKLTIPMGVEARPADLDAFQAWITNRLGKAILATDIKVTEDTLGSFAAARPADLHPFTETHGSTPWRCSWDGDVAVQDFGDYRLFYKWP